MLAKTYERETTNPIALCLDGNKKGNTLGTDDKDDFCNSES